MSTASLLRRRLTRWPLLAVVGLCLTFVLPALAVYGFFTLQSLAKSVQYSFYSWNGIGEAKWVGLANYAEVFSDPRRVTALLNAFKLIFFYSFLSIALGLIAATLIRGLNSRWSRASQTLLFLPQVVPLVGAGIAWTWLYYSDGAVNQILRAIGLGGVARAWLADFTFALPAIGIVGTWVLIGLCTMLLSAGMTKIDPALYDAARVDGAGPIREFFAVTLPGVRGELTVDFEQERFSVSYGGIVVAAGGVTVPHDEAAVAAHMARRDLEITCDLGLGNGTFQVITNDLTHEYIDENTGGS